MFDFKKNNNLYLAFYILFSVLFIGYQSSIKNINLKGTILLFGLLIVIASFLILYLYDKNLPIYKMAFILILIFGVLCVFLSPIVSISDESEHFARSEMTSRGVIEPVYVNNTNHVLRGYETIASVHGASSHKLGGKTVFETTWDDKKINYNKCFVGSSFAQNPFYGYIPQAIGIDIAKCLNLNNIWMLWLGRLCNLLMYAFIVSYAIKKAPHYKKALFLTACFPLAISQAGSLSIDATVNSLALLTISYFLYIYFKEDSTVGLRDVSIFLILDLLCGLTKVTYLGLILLIFLVPKSRFNFKKSFYYSRIGFIFVFIIGLLWSHFAEKQLAFSWRASHALKHGVNPTIQLLYISNHLGQFLTTLFDFNNLKILYLGLFYFGHGHICSFTSLFLVITFFVFYWVFALDYPEKQLFNKKTRIGIFLISCIIYYGTLFVQYLTWCPIGATQIYEIEFGRYFIPLVALGPMIFNLNNDKILHKFPDKLFYVLIISFMSILVLLTFTTFY